MSDFEKPVDIHPIEASADGKRNAYSARCDVLGQAMNYAACLWRQSVLGLPNVKTAADWEPCRQAASCGRCVAAEMRKEELLKGHSIYFRDRTVMQRLVHKAREWVMPSTDAIKPAAPKFIPIAPAKPARAESMLDAMGEGSGYADAINSMVSEGSGYAAPVAAVVPVPAPRSVGPTLVALPGESPLAMARRMAAERKSQSQPA